MSNLGCFVADDAQKLLELGQGQCLSWMLTVTESNWSTVFLISQAELQHAMDIVFVRCDTCLQVDGNCFQHLPEI